MEKKIIRVGMVGTGMIFDRHCRGIKASPDAEVTAICDVNKDALARKAKLVGVPMEATFTDYTKMMDSGLIDAVVICTPNDSHVQIALEAIKRDLPFAMEKPVGVNVEEVRMLNDKVRETKTKNTVLFTYRFKASARFAKDIIDSGVLGKIYHVNTEYYQDYDLRPYSLPTFWRFDKKAAGGGVVFDLGSHVMDLVTFMTGLDYESLCATAENLINTRPDPETGEIKSVSTDDYCHMMVNFTSGATGVFAISKCCMGRKNYQRIQIYGEKGVIIYTLTDKNLEDTIEVCLGQPYVDTYDYKKLDIPQKYYAEQMQAFIDVINGCGDGLTADMEDGLRAQELIEKVYESSETKSWVDVGR